MRLEFIIIITKNISKSQSCSLTQTLNIISQQNPKNQHCTKSIEENRNISLSFKYIVAASEFLSRSDQLLFGV